MASLTATQLHTCPVLSLFPGVYIYPHGMCMHKGYLIIAAETQLDVRGVLVSASVGEDGQITIVNRYQTPRYPADMTSFRAVLSDANYIYAFGCSSTWSFIRAFTLTNGVFSIVGSDIGVGNITDIYGLYPAIGGGYIYAMATNKNIAAYTFNGSSFTKVCEGANSPYQIRAMGSHIIVNFAKSDAPYRGLVMLKVVGAAFTTVYIEEYAGTTRAAIKLSNDKILFGTKIYQITGDTVSLVSQHDTYTSDNIGEFTTGTELVYIRKGRVEVALRAAPPYTVYYYAIPMYNYSFFEYSANLCVIIEFVNGDQSTLVSYRTALVEDAPPPPEPPVSDIVEAKGVPVTTIAIPLNSGRAFIAGIKTVNTNGDTYIQVTDYRCRSDYQDVQRNILIG
jgi:hypothetical protein